MSAAEKEGIELSNLLFRGVVWDMHHSLEVETRQAMF